MANRRATFAAGIAGAGITLWLLLLVAEIVTGADTGGIAVSVLVVAGLAGVFAYRHRSGAGHAQAVSPAERRAWIGTAVTAVAIGYFVTHVRAFQVTDLLQAADAQAVARNLVLLLIAASVLTSAIRSRRHDAIEEDERDHQIARRAAQWGHGVQSLLVLSLAVTIGLSPAARLPWATLPMIGSLLLFALMVGALFRFGVGAVLHWADRR